MSDPKRLLDDDQIPELERKLLASSDVDRPSPESRAKAMAALGLAPPPPGSPSGSAAEGTPLSGDGGSGAAGSASGPGLSGATALTSPIFKGIGVVAVASVVAAGGYQLTKEPPGISALRKKTEAVGEPLAPVVEPVEPVVEPIAEPVADSVEAPPVEAERRPSPSPRPPSSPLSKKKTRVEPKTEPLPTDHAGLGRETMLIDRAQKALARQDYARALKAVEEHNAAFPKGALVPEAMGLRILGLAGIGDRESARKLAATFAERYPSYGPMLERIRALRLEPGK